MGKTFVALAVAVSVALSNRRKRPVVVMVPPSLKEKWPADFEMFREKCLPRDIAGRVKYGRAERAEEFLKLLDDPPERKKAILFVTHGAMSRGLTDKWVMLALIYQALRRRRGTGRLRTALTRVMPQLLRMRRAERYGPELWGQLLENHPSRWLDILHEWGVDPEWDNDPTTDDDPVPRAVWEVLPRLRTDRVFEALQGIPLKQSRHFDDRLQVARAAIKEELRSLWQECVRSLRLRLPLLILDEAHHLRRCRRN
jgi:hypothetical protein